MNLVEMTPRADLCSTGYCLANPVEAGAEYLVFLPADAAVAHMLDQLDIDREISLNLLADSRVKVDLTSSPFELSVEWFNPENGNYTKGASVLGGSSQVFTAPFSDDAILHVYDK